MANARTVLVTNDDGIDSLFLRALLEAHLQAGFEAIVAAPLQEQSWISRALTRRGEVAVHPQNGWPCKAWALDGTPTDCVNIALGHLLEKKPDAVISGINLGYNANLPFVLGSGTVAGALEGAFWGLPAAAYSLQLPIEQFEQIRASKGVVSGLAAESLKHAAAHAAELTAQVIEQESGRPMHAPRVHNFNFPRVTLPDTPVEDTHMGRLRQDTYFEKTPQGTFRFKFPYSPPCDGREDTDEHCLNMRARISHTLIDYGKL